MRGARASAGESSDTRTATGYVRECVRVMIAGLCECVSVSVGIVSTWYTSSAIKMMFFSTQKRTTACMSASPSTPPVGLPGLITAIARTFFPARVASS
jgi:hypothetical protein